MDWFALQNTVYPSITQPKTFPILKDLVVAARAGFEFDDFPGSTNYTTGGLRFQEIFERSWLIPVGATPGLSELGCFLIARDEDETHSTCPAESSTSSPLSLPCFNSLAAPSEASIANIKREILLLLWRNQLLDPEANKAQVCEQLEIVERLVAEQDRSTELMTGHKVVWARKGT